MNAQTVQEAKRIITVVDDLLEDLEVLSMLPPYLSAMPAADMQHITNSFKGPKGGREAQNQLSEHFDMERKLESAAAEASQEEVAEHHLSTRQLIDTLRHAGYPRRYRASFPTAESIQRFHSIIATLRSLLHDRFNTTVEEDVQKFTILNDTVNREKTASADVQALNREHANEKQSRKVEVAKKDQAISKLRDELHLIQENARDEQESFEQVSAEQRDSDKSRYEKEQTNLEAEVKRLEGQLKTLEDQCQNAELQARQLRTKKESALQQVISHYDHEMTTSTDAVNNLQTEIDRDAEALRKVEDELAIYTADNERVRLEEATEDMRRGHRMKLDAQTQENARMIQAFWRAYAVRLSLTKKKKKKK